MSSNPSEQLTELINTLDIALEAIPDAGDRAAVAHGVGERARLLQALVAPALRAAVAQMHAAGASHADVAARLGVSRARAQQLAGIPVLLFGGPSGGQVLYAAAERTGRPNRQLVVAMSGGVANYWRRVVPEADGTWMADFFPGTTAPANWTVDLTTSS